MNKTEYPENVILVDADFLDHVTFDLIVNFERMIDRRIDAGDLCHWLDCIALDGGLRPGDNKIQVIFLHSKDKEVLRHMKPSHLKNELNGMAFKDNLGEFGMLSYPVEELVSAEDFYVQSFQALVEEKAIKRVLAVGDMAAYGERLKRICMEAEDTDITLFTMEPTTGRGFAQEILGYSLMSALRISSEEIK